MRILVLSEENSFNSASYNRIIGLVKGMRLVGAEISVFYIHGDIKQIGGEITGVKGNRFLNIWRFFKTKFRLSFREVGGKIRAFNPDIIWIPNGFNFLLWIWVNGYSRKSFLFTELNEFPDIYKHHKFSKLGYFHALLSKLVFEKIILPKLSGLALMTESLIDHYRTNHKVEISICHLPMTVDPTRFNINSRQLATLAEGTILYVGVLNDYKDGVDILIKAFIEIASEYSNSKLMLVGPFQPESSSHMKIIRESGFSDRIYYRGPLERELVPELMKQASVLVLPRPDSYQARGGFPTKLGEYLMSGNPVCATQVGELSTYLVDEESVYFAEAGSIDSLKLSLRKILSDPQTATIVGQRGRDVALQHFNSEIQAQVLYKYLTQQLKSFKHDDKG